MTGTSKSPSPSSASAGSEPTAGSNLSSLQAARSAVAALTAAGVTDVVIAPGSRSAPLAYALAEAEVQGRVKVHVRIDERVAGFTALGLARGGHRPAAVVTTSGTAVGELMPAVMEAHHAGVPLVVLSADRPAELHGTGANQTTVQPGIFAEFPASTANVRAGDDPAGAIGAAFDAVSAGSPVGPIHINLQFRDPLIPQDGDTAELAVPDAETPAELPAEPAATGREAAALANHPGTHRAVVIAGDGAGEIAALFARRAGLPLLAEPSSNARFGPNAIAAYRLLLEELGPEIERVVVFGRPTLSRPVAALLARRDVEKAIYVPRPVNWFTAGRRPETIITDLAGLFDFAGEGTPGWLERWQAASAAASAALSSLLEGRSELNGLHVADLVWDHTDGNLVLGSSNPIRDLDLMAAPDWHPLDVYANRGLAGIDGTIATASGIALANGIPTRLLLGDLTFLHDAGALLLGTGEPEPDLQIVVLNDGGGGIFATLEHGALGEEQTEYTAVVERFFGTPHTVDVSALAAAYGVPHRLVRSIDELDAALDAPVAGRSILEVPVQRASLRELHAKVKRAVQEVLA
ncbi:2-succinyl-5-enolpyruvyl-6-hydroxy-3-cyclohexene-1-carboxylic-acid synthase [Arthrobacter sp. zg-Y820]|uniref:2-succinyl-5-enolpyruvyl-6-hydroxy-3- cyclohexene-1-carboxylic-acid synthase n=1 Tax=unclassified Arthrobacter TaxID=235627 RepID=UPI002541F212|nr:MULTISPECIES: 2-succinyl-5-enolpyruvyl-6-hydroxy-3-cyclohexene-1-carboxylic-acid synthase [unclassified Arthrobacter]MCC9195680.1 2-succinyl-5-enolpyruvyl-6-hydroxy-3-cyclohexene-1-carboxylic-acid synthase [Arthrobacter sp. zg-Y820]MDK1278539.1 2-succinyl-5-enolpyruvyl-6-hydroxy-3-cyclohexene-1-carboxylic-acid synthase [Arthrobacter sp. zg.Y820]WIB09025.1 2-succinyl-5-enolpyruvyl-6-hydroxy-3-cyclohexene-1-carboxylic-acid synthase [Arthrobacter sp. zg-Y820]